MDLEKELKSYPELSTCLDEIINSCNKIWNNPLLPWFTKHDVSHSQEIIHLLGQILYPLENTPQKLNEHELFILLASTYLHDIGMQYLKVDDISIDKLTSDEYELIRKEHAEKSYELILQRVKGPIDRDDFYLPIIDDDYLPVIANVSKGHSTGFFEETIKHFQEHPAKTKNRDVRAGLLTSLLMISDELDLQSKRADFPVTTKFNLSDYSEVHWYKHHYVDGVGVNKGTIYLSLKFPENADEYKSLVEELIETKLREQIDKVNPILIESTGGLLHLNGIKIDIQVDNTGTKRELPDGALKELKRILKEHSPVVSDNKGVEDIVPLSIPRPSNIFTGRKDELERFKDVLEQSNLISIEGLGGIGKTELAAKYIEEYTPQGKAVWFECLPDTKLDSLIDCCGYSDVIKGETKTELAKYSGFLSLAERDGKIIFLDNYQNISDESFRDFFKYSEKRLRKVRIVLIAREHPPLGGIPVLPVTLEGLEKYSVEYAKKVISRYYSDVEIDDKSLQSVCDTVDGHPLAINLAIQLLHYGETTDNIINKLVYSKGINEELSHRLLDEIFDHPKSTEQEKELLLNFSIFRNKVFLNAFEYILDNSDRMETLHKLIDKHMIIRYGNLYGAHPLVREFCYARLDDKEKLHLKAYEYLKAIRGEKLDIVLEEEIFYHLLNSEQLQELAGLISENGEDFILLGHTNFLKDMMDAVVKSGIEQAIFYLYYGDIAQIRGEWDGATKYFEKSFSIPDVDEKTNAMAYIKYGEMLFRKGEVKESLEYFEKGLDNCRKINFKRGEARSLNDIGLVDQVFGNFDIALEKLNKALDLNKDILDESGISNNLNNIGNVLCDKGKKGDLDDALEKYEESHKIMEEIKDKAGMALSLCNIGITLAKKEELDGAMMKCEESLKIRKEIGEKEGIAHSLNGIGNVLLKNDDLDGAMDKYEESYKITKEIGNKSGMVWSLNNIGVVLNRMGNLDGAKQKLEESFEITKEIGDKRGIALFLWNIGTTFFENKDYRLALKSLFQSIALYKQMGIEKQDLYDYVSKISEIQDFKKFKKLAEEAFEKLPDDLKPFIDVTKFVEDKTIHVTQKPGRNTPCPCGSGKKYKQCCGRS